MVAILLLLYAGPLLPGIDTMIAGKLFMVIAVFLTLWSMAYYLQMAAREFSGKKIDV